MGSERAEVGAGVADVDLSGRVALVTGATSGIGTETALALGRLGADVVVHGRDRERGTEVAARIDDADGPGRGEFLAADFAALENVRYLATAVRDRYDRLDVLVNNAGGLFREAGRSEEGVELTFAVNHLAGFVLTNRLAPRLASTTGARVVTVASSAYRLGKLRFDDLRSVDRYSAWTAYARSKLANVAFTAELTRRFDAADAGVTANCLHPGTIPGSNFAREYPAPLRALAPLVGRLPLLASDVTEGAETPVYLAAAPGESGASGGYYVDCERRHRAADLCDRRDRERLWTVSEQFADLDATVGDGLLDAT